MAKRIKTTETQSSSPLTLTNLSKYDKQNDETQIITLADGKFTLTINKTFRPTQIQKMIIDMQEAFTTMRSEQVDLEDVSNMLIIYHMCILKYFTTLPIKHLDMSKKLDLAKIIAVAKQLLDSGIFKEILESFDPIEMAKIDKSLKDNKEISNQFGELFARIVLTETVEGDDNGGSSESE